MQVNLKIIKSRRKTISLSVNKDAELVARVPYNYNPDQLKKFINEKSKWIAAHIKQVQENNQKYAPFVPINGAELTLLGQPFVITIKNITRAKIIENQIILPNKNTKEYLIALLKKYAKQQLDIRVNQYAKEFGFNYNQVRIGSAKTVWGSCSATNNLNFSYRLLFTPNIVVDYVIIHELSHTIVRNHSKEFYQIVADCMPEYKSAEKWLKQNKGVINCL